MTRVATIQLSLFVQTVFNAYTPGLPELDAQSMYLNRMLGMTASLWGIVGVIGILSFAVMRMAGHTIDAWSYDLGIWHYVVLVLWTFFMAYSEGYKGFQKGFSPRVASRCVYLVERCTWLRLLLAPLFCMGFFHTSRRRQITVIILVVVITSIVILFRQIPQPWRGVLDFGVVVGLSWGILATLIYFIRFAVAKEVLHDPEVIEPESLVAANQN